MSGQIILFDLPSKDRCHCWSLNPWKTRLLLNYKGLDYKTEWVEYPDIKSTLEKHVPANDGTTTRFPYSIPAVKFPDGTYTMESRKIVDRVEKLHPSPSIHLDSPYMEKIEKLMVQAGELRPAFVNKVPNRLLREASLEYWYDTRGKMFDGKPLPEVDAELGGEVCFKKLKPFTDSVGDLLKENKGPYFEGSQVTYADFVYAGYLKFLERIGDDLFNGVLDQAKDKQVHLDLLEACRPWMKRDD